MGDTTAISWCDHTFNPWIGCTEVSNGPKGACVGCYARELAARYGFAQWGDYPRHRTSEANWRKPLAWDRAAAKGGTRPFVFCASLADVFDNQVPAEWRRDLFVLIRATPHLTWLLLTKRPQNMLKLYLEACPWTGAERDWPKNVAIGCTVVTQEEADRDIPHLIRAKNELNPAFAFLSMEPLMGPVDLTYPETIWPNGVPVCCDGRECGCMGKPVEPPLIWGIDWIIAGGETSQGKHRARPSRPAWFRSIRDQCDAAGVPFHFKQWGEWTPGENVQRHHGLVETATWFDERWDFAEENLANHDGYIDDEPDLYRVGKKAAGATLDGREHREFPA